MQQANDFVDILYPEKDENGRRELAKEITRKTKLVGREQVEREVENLNAKDIFEVGRMYLHAVDPAIEKSAAKRREFRPPGRKLIGYHDGEIVLRKGWLDDAYNRTTPIHEAVHSHFGAGEFKADLF